ncbi:hypothetical protein EON65_41515 [archaeon]|nr:MAG: hypothetical protein EON65_41515 [archaeon]
MYGEFAFIITLPIDSNSSSYFPPNWCLCELSKEKKVAPFPPDGSAVALGFSSAAASYGAEVNKEKDSANGKHGIQDIQKMLDSSNNNVGIIPEDNNLENENALLTKGVKVMDSALQVHEGATFAFVAAGKMYETIQGKDSEDCKAMMIQDAVAVAGSVAETVFPILLDLGKTVPIVGPVAAIALHFYGSVKSYLENKEDLQELIGRVQDCMLWFKQTGPHIVVLSKEHCDQLERYLAKLVAVIMEANEMMQEWKDRWSASKVLLSDRDKDTIRRLAREVEKARNDISLHATSVLFEMCLQDKSRKGEQQDLQELRKLVGEVETSFRSDIEVHLARFVRGSRGWMHEVSCCI